MAATPYGVSDRLRLCLPALLTLLLQVLMASPVLTALHYTPLISMLCLFFFRLYAPAAMAYGACALIGLVQDTLSGVPLGVYGTAFLLASFALERVARNILRQPFRLVWVSASGFVLLSFLLALAASKLAGVMMDVQAAAWQAGVTALCYPAVHGLCLLMMPLLPAPAARG